MSKFKIGDKVKCVTPTSACGVEVGGIYTIKDPQHHYGTYYGKRHNHVILEEVSSTPNEGCLELYEEEVKQPISYREMSPDSKVKVKIGDYEFDCPIKELLLACNLFGVISGKVRTDVLYDNTTNLLNIDGKDLLVLNNKIVEFKNVEEFYREYFKPFYDKQNDKETLMKDIEEQKAILKNQQEFLKELENKYNSL